MTGLWAKKTWFRKLKCEQGPQPFVYGNYQGIAARWLDSGSPAGKSHSIAKADWDELLKITVPAHRPVKRSTLSHILKQARLDVDRFLELV